LVKNNFLLGAWKKEYCTGGSELMIVITGGGTGGHIFPNVSIIGELQKRGYEDIVWVGEKRGKEKKWAQRFGVRYCGIQAGKLRRYFSLRNFSDMFRVCAGVFQSFFLFLKLRPGVVFSKGGFVAVPPVCAARLLHIPVVTHESDILPGLATRIIARSSRIVCVSWKKTEACFPGKNVVLTGNPVRDVITKGEREKGLLFLGFHEPLPVVLVIGGSLGASSLNSAVWEMRERFHLPFNLVHQCGEGKLRRGQVDDPRYRAFEFIHEEMGDVLAASDIVVSRSGAGALFEIGFMKKPSVLVPLPISKSRGEQLHNARYFSENGAAVILDDDTLNGELLFSAVRMLLQDPSRMKDMGKKAASLCTKNAAKKIVDTLEPFLA
jgi:UDP-N-acetylglucosamine--N-acetylmuramyl-(pentapeptide) pyrophosphoryl-undecaprenol N-acetylglucosamine transferase